MTMDEDFHESFAYIFKDVKLDADITYYQFKVVNGDF
jgi:hypothetical protein